MMVAWRERHDQHVHDRRTSRRLVLEYGSILSGSADATPRRSKVDPNPNLTQP